MPDVKEVHTAGGVPCANTCEIFHRVCYEQVVDPCEAGCLASLSPCCSMSMMFFYTARACRFEVCN